MFCGGCSIESRISGYDEVICNDIQEYLVALWQAAQKGYVPPDIVTKEDYDYIKNHKDENKALTGFVGFTCSFGGKWFNGYAWNNSGRNYAKDGQRSLLKDIGTLKDATFTCMDYREVELPEDCVVYADPPYAGTTPYKGLDKFDSESFWEYMREISKDHLVFISEQNAPEDFVSIWEKPLRRILDVNKKNNFTVIEKLFVHESNLNKIKQNQLTK